MWTTYRELGYQRLVYTITAIVLDDVMAGVEIASEIIGLVGRPPSESQGG
jgi:hypothetical protein